MKKLIFALGLMVISLTAISQFSPYNGQTSYNRGQSNSSSNHNNATRGYAPRVAEHSYDNREMAKRARMSGNYTYYLAGDFRNYNINPVDGVNTVAGPIETDAIMQMPVKGGIRWTIIEAGSICRYQVVGGRRCQIPYALDACGNAILDIEFILEEQAPAPIVASSQTTYSYNQRPCPTCPGGKELYNYSLNPPAPNLNYYSERGQNTYYPPEPPVVYNNQRKGMPGIVKVLIGTVVLSGITYAILHKSASEPTDHEVITLEPTSAKAKLDKLKTVSFTIKF